MGGGGSGDLLYGGDGADSLRGGAGKDRLFGEEGQDFLSGGEGDDLLYGGQGRDTFVVAVDLEDANGYQERSAGHDVIMDFDTDTENLALSRIPGLGGQDGLLVEFKKLDSNKNGVLDDDDILIKVHSVTVEGIAKLSTVIDVASALEIGTPFSQTLTVHGVTGLTAEDIAYNRRTSEDYEGTSGPDVVNGTALTSYFYGRDGADVIRGRAGDDLLVGDNGDDRIDGGVGDDFVLGGDGSDRLLGGSGEDVILADRWGFDAYPLVGTADDRLFGDDGDDILSSGMGQDVMTGGAGRDIFSVLGFGMFDGNVPVTIDAVVTDFVRGEDFLNSETLPLAAYDSNGDGRLRANDADIRVEQVIWEGQAKASMVVDIQPFVNGTGSPGTLTLIGVTELNANDFAAGGYR